MGYEDKPTIPDAELNGDAALFGLREIPHTYLNGDKPKEPKPYPLAAILGATAWAFALVALFVAVMGHSTTVHQTVNQDVSKAQARQVSQLSQEVTTLQGQVATDNAKLAKLTGQVNGQLGSVNVSRYGDACTEPGFSFPCAPLG